MFGRKKKEQKEPDPFNIPFGQMLAVGAVSAVLMEAFDLDFGTYMFLIGCGMGGILIWKARTYFNQGVESANAARKAIQSDYDAYAGKVAASQNNAATYAANERRIAELKRELEMALQQEAFLTEQLNNR